ncbi:MAG: thiamine pyrophosphate-dependent dehydrogenase E1 component subunit alpha [Anaerolineae bacterium]|jgi:2-oxoisovalerate dehydrogenase E1 component alpha subunit
MSEPELDLLHAYRLMVLARTIDEREWMLNRQGKIPFVVSCQGQEAAQVGMALALQPGVDHVLPYYRDIALVLALGMTPYELFLNLFAKADDPNSGGRQMPNHWAHNRWRIYSHSSPVATQIPHAAGVALASQLKGEDAVTLVTFGEGATSKGDFHEALNFAGIHALPVIFACENNRYAISVPQVKQMAIENVADRAAAYGMAGEIVDGQDLAASHAATARAVAHARAGEGPTLLEFKTYRLVPHTSDDDDRRYRAREEVAEWKERDPIQLLKARLIEAGTWDEEQDQALREEVFAQVSGAQKAAEAAPDPEPQDALRHVFYEGG